MQHGLQCPRQGWVGAELGAAGLPRGEIGFDRQAGASGPPVQGAKGFEMGRISLVFGKDRKAGRLGEGVEAARHLDLGPMRHEPGAQIIRVALVVRQLAVALDNVLAIDGDCGSKAAVIDERRVARPVIGKARQAMQRERLNHRLLQPLTRRRGLGIRAPGVRRDMAKFVAELVGELAPVPLSDDDQDPADTCIVIMQPDGRRTGGLLRDEEALGLIIGDEPHPLEAGATHALDNVKSRVGNHVSPIATEFDRSA